MSRRGGVNFGNARFVSGFLDNRVVFSDGFSRIEDLEDALPEEFFLRENLPWEAAFLAGKCFLAYRRRKGLKTAPLPDFYIGAHAAVSDLILLTRDAGRYRAYFPRLKLMAPGSA